MSKKPIKIILITIFITLIFLGYSVGCVIVSHTSTANRTLSIIFGFAEISTTAVGALLGFGASLFLQNYFNILGKKKAISNIISEMANMVVLIELINDNNDFDYIKKSKNRIYIPIWDSVLQNGDLLMFKDEDYFEPLIAVYTVIISIKSKVDTFGGRREDFNDFIKEFNMECQELKNQLNKFTDSDKNINNEYMREYSKIKSLYSTNELTGGNK